MINHATHKKIRTIYFCLPVLLMVALLIEVLPLSAKDVDNIMAEQMLESILKSAPSGIGVVENRVLVQVNDYILELTGYSQEELIGNNARMLYPTQEESDYVGNEKYRQISKKGTGSVETRWLRKDGTIRHVILSSTPLDPSDLSAGVTFTVLDITDRKLAEAVLMSRTRWFLAGAALFSLVLLFLLIRLAASLKRQQAAAKELSVERERLRSIAANVPGVVYQFYSTATGDHGMNYLSERTAEIFGFDKPPCLDDFFPEVVRRTHPDDREALMASIQNAVTQCIPWRFEFRFVKSSGEVAWFSGASNPTLSHDRIIFDGLLLDITERKQAEMELRKAQLITDNIPVGLHLYHLEDLSDDRTLRMVYANPVVKALTGLGPEDVVGKTLDENFSGLRAQGIPQRYAEVVRTQTAITFEDIAYGDNRVFWASFSVNAFPLPGNMVGIAFENITERKQAEENLRSAHEKMLTILDSIDSTVYVADMNTHEILFMNQQMINDFGGDKTGNICFKVFRNQSEACDCCTNDRLFDENGRPAGIYTWHDRNPVSGKLYINHDRVIEWTDGRQVRLQIATDITDLKKMETQLLQAQKMESIGRLAGGVAHDFNNMLGVILGHTELALLRTDDKHELCSDLNEIQKAAKRSADITKQLLAFARKQTISPRKLDLNNTVESMLNMLRRLIGEDIDLAWNPAPCLWSVKMDPSQIDQILANLCVNARDAIDGVGKLTIETGRKTFDEEYCKEHAGFIPGDFVLLAVSDNGCGMDKETLDNLFEPFFTTKEVGKGTGLGLATIYGIVKQNNGFINVYSEPGRGSTFKVYLPRFVVTEDTDKAVPVKKAAAGGSETILLVEDEPMILDMTTTMLEMLGYTVLAAASPDEAIRLAKDHTGKVHLLMSDVVMPEMNGRDLAGQIVHLYPGIRLLFMSGYTANVIAHQGVLDAGVAFIQKPFSMADMTEMVREVLDMAPEKS